MSNARKTFSLLLVTPALVVWAGYVSAPASAQQAKPGAACQQDDRHPPPRDARGPGQHRPRARFGRFPGRNLFRPLPEDQGSLTPAERRELLRFVRKHVPHIHGELRELRRRDPDAFERGLQEHAPRLRQLRRIFERDPQLGRNIVRHAENRYRIGRARRAWIESENHPERRRRIHTAARRMVAENLRIEAAVLEDHAAELEGQRDERIAAEFERLRSADVDLAGEPAQVRELVQQLHAAPTDDEREALLAELQQICAQRTDREVAGLRRRAERIRANAVEEVDRRMQRLTSRPERGPRDRPGPRRGNQRRGESQPRHDAEGKRGH